MRKRYSLSLNPENPRHQEFLRTVQAETHPTEFIVNCVLGNHVATDIMQYGNLLATQKDLQDAVNTILEHIENTKEKPKVTQDVLNLMDW